MKSCICDDGEIGGNTNGVLKGFNKGWLLGGVTKGVILRGRGDTTGDYYGRGLLRNGV